MMGTVEEAKKENGWEMTDLLHVSYAWTVLYQLVQRRDSCGERPALIMYLPPQKHPGEFRGASVTPVPLNLHVFQKSISSNINTTDKEMLRVLKLLTKWMKHGWQCKQNQDLVFLQNSSLSPSLYRDKLQ